MTEYQLIDDQPMTCPKCGARTDWVDLADGTQSHTCLGCGYTFLACEDDELASAGDDPFEFEFRLIAYDETSYWGPVPEGCTHVYGIYLFRPGEGIHVCSLTPSSWHVFVENVFVGLMPDDPFAEEHRQRGDSNYFHYIDPDRLPKLASAPITVEAETSEEAWELAEEQAHANPPMIWNLRT